MTGKGGFTLRADASLQVFRQRLFDLDIRLDDRFPGSTCPMACNKAPSSGEARRFSPIGMIVCTEPLTEGARSKNGCALQILQGAGYDLGGRGGTAVDEHDQRLAIGQVSRACVEAAGIIGVTATGRNDLAALQKGVGDIDRLIEKSTRIEAQVKDKALQLVGRYFLLDLGDRRFEVIIGLFREGDDPQIADIAFDAGLDRANCDDFANDAELDRLVRPPCAGW